MLTVASAVPLAALPSIRPGYALNILAVHRQSIEVGFDVLPCARHGDRALFDEIEERPLDAVSAVVGSRAVHRLVAPEVAAANVRPCDCLLGIHLLLVRDSVDAGAQRPLGDKDRDGPGCHPVQVRADLVKHVCRIVLQGEGALSIDYVSACVWDLGRNSGAYDVRVLNELGETVHYYKGTASLAGASS